MGTVVLPSTSGRPVLNCRNKKKGSSPTGRKKTPTYRTAHPPTTGRSAPSTHPSTKPLLHTAEQQCSSPYIRAAVRQYVQQYTPGTRGAVSWLVLVNEETAKKDSHVQNGPPTHHGRRSAPSTHPPTKPLLHTAEQQCSSPYIRTAVQQYVQQYKPGTRGAVSWLVLRKQEKAKKRLHVQNGPPTHHGRRSAPSTHPPTKPLLHTAEQQCSSTYIKTAVQQYVQQYKPGTRGAVGWLVLMKQETAKKRLPRTERSTHPPRTTQCTLYPPTDQNFTTYSRTAVQQFVHQNSSAAVCTAQQNSSAAVRTSEQPCSSTYSRIHLVRGAQLVGWFL